MTATPITVLLVEDEPAWQQGIQLLLEMQSDIQLKSIVDNAEDAEVFFRAFSPDVVLIDWKIKGPRDGLELATVLAREISPSRIILVTGSPVEQIPTHPYGYVPKSRISQDLVSAIQEAVAGR